MYKILAGDNVIYDSTNKYDYPCTEPVLNLELGEAGNLEFTLLPGHPMHDAIEEMQTFVTAYQDDDILFDGRVLQAEEDTFGQVRCTCEGALTFLLDSEMEPNTYTETIREFFARCIDAHNNQVEERKQFAVGYISHDEADEKLEFKLEGYNKTREVLNNLLVSKHGGSLRVRYANGLRYLDYIQQYTNVTNQPIKIGYNVIDKTKHISGENLFTILRPLGKNNLTIEGASSENLMEGASFVEGKYLSEENGDKVVSDDAWAHSSQFIPITPGGIYHFGPCNMRFTYYDDEQKCISSEWSDDSHEVKAPNNAYFVRLSYPKEFANKIIFKLPGRPFLPSSNDEEGKMLCYVKRAEDELGPQSPTVLSDEEFSVDVFEIQREYIQEASDWNYCPTYISNIHAGDAFLVYPGSASVIYYKFDSESNDYKPYIASVPEDDLGGDIFVVPSSVDAMRVSYSNIYGESTWIESIGNGDNLASRGSSAAGYLDFSPVEIEEEDSAWCYTELYIPIEENCYYTGGPSQIKVSFYDKDKNYLSMAEAHREGMTMHYVKSPVNAAFARVSFLTQYQEEQQFQKGKALILTKLDKGTKTILLPERIAKYGQIIHSESFSEITDPQELYNAAIEWVSLHHSMLPASLDYGIVDFHLLNPEIDMFEIGDVYDNIEGFEDEALTIGSLSKNMENPANDTLTLKNLAELMGPDAGKSSGSLSSKYAASGNGGGSGGSGSGGSSTEEEETIPKDILIKALESIGIEAPRIRLLAEERDGLKARIDLIAKGASGNQSRISMTESAIELASKDILLEAQNIYNIADHVTTLAGTVYTHANLIWNEAKDIVTIAENLYIVADNISILADTIRIKTNRMDLEIGELNADIGTINADIGTINANIGTINADIGTINANIGTLNANIGEANVNIGRLTTQISELNADIGDATVRIDNLDLFVDRANTSFNTLNAEIGELNAWVGEADVTFGTLNESIGTLNSDIGNANVNIETLTASVGTLNASVDSLELAVGDMLIDGDEITINGNTIKIGSVIDDEVTGGMIVSKINELDGSDTTVTKIKGDLVYVQATDLASWGVFTNDTLTAGVIAEKLTGKTPSQNQSVLKLLGDEIDISGNTMINGFLTIRETATAKDFIINKNVKLGDSTTSYSLSNAVIGVSKSGNQVTFSFANGGSEVINFKSADSFKLVGGWSNGAFVVDMVDAAGGSTVYHTEGSGTITRSITDAQIKSILESSNAHRAIVTVDDVSNEENLFNIVIDASGVYQQGVDSVVQRSANSIGTILLGRSDIGSSVNKTATVFYEGGGSTPNVPVTISGADLVYAAGQDSVVQRSIARIDAVYLPADHTSGTITITGAYSDNTTFTAAVTISAVETRATAYSLGEDDGKLTGWNAAKNAIARDDNRIVGPISGYGNTDTLFTITSAARSDGSIYWAGQNFARHDFTGIARINGEGVSETSGSQANAMPT